jgi:hypothetical protein
VEHIARQRKALGTFNKKANSATDHQRHLFMWVGVLRSDKERRETKTTDHHLFANHHLSLDARGRMLDGNGGPVEVLRTRN